MIRYCLTPLAKLVPTSYIIFPNSQKYILKFTENHISVDLKQKKEIISTLKLKYYDYLCKVKQK